MTISKFAFSALLLPLLLAACAVTETPLPVPAAPVEREVAIDAEGGTLNGTLLDSGRRDPALEPALILAGSGPTDRDGNSPAGLSAASYRLLASGLAEQGISTLRVDKRGIAASAAAMPSEADLRIQHYADDAVAWADRLREETGARCVWLIGHSEGSLHASLAARRSENLCGLVLISPVSKPAGSLIRDQLNANPANAPILPEALRILDELEAGRQVPGEGVNPFLAPLFRPSVQPFLISMLKLDPAALLAAYDGPVLIVQGTTDLQTPAQGAERLKQARPGIELRMIEGMNHVLKVAPADRAANLATYADPSLPLAPGLVEAIAGFIASR